MQTMALYINNDSFQGIKIMEKEIKCCQLADDTAIFFKDISQVKKVIECLNIFSKASGLSLNVKKMYSFST